MNDRAILIKSVEIYQNKSRRCKRNGDFLNSQIIPLIVRQMDLFLACVDICNIEFDLTVGEICRGLTAIIRAFVRSDVAAESTARYQGADLGRSTEFSESEHVAQGPLVEY